MVDWRSDENGSAMEKTWTRRDSMPTQRVTLSKNPATGEILGRIPENSIEELNRAVATARLAQKEWYRLSYGERAKHLLRSRDFIVENVDRIAEVISKETGKTRMDALSTEVLPVSMAVTYYATKAEGILKKKKVGAGSVLTINKRSYVERVPLGVVGIISPWNYPFSIPFHEIAMALIAGNGVILKVASQTQLVGQMIKESVDAGRFPDNLFHLVNLPGSMAGDAFLESGIHKLFFTGSVAAGKKLMAKAAERLIPVSLELGGNDAMIVCSDANIHRAVGGALWGGLSNCGQSCAGVERIFVEEGIYDPFITLLKDRLNRLTQGIDRGSNVEIGSLTTEQQLKKVEEFYQDAILKGATSYPDQETVARQTKGLFHPPVILEKVDDSMRVMREEIFGPILAVQKVRNPEEAIARTNNSSLGLTASVWTNDRQKGKQIASNLEVGAVMINDHLMSHGLAETPWGGFKESGIGRTHSFLGLEEMTQPRVIIDDILPGVQKNLWWYPHTIEVYEGLRGALHFIYSKRLLKKIKGGIKLLKIFTRTLQK
jgi:succinate-semialdehyde dehydrogenase/glutarate-semialdehyde dehydrogenase